MENDATILGDEIMHGERDIIEFSYSEIMQATSDLIGEGGFGAVYRGKLRGIERAIKILKEQDHASKLTKEEDHQTKVNAYKHEVNVLSVVQHPNIVRLIGTCKEKFVIVYEFMSGGNLHHDLIYLNWEERLRVATEICSVLSSIHNRRPEVLVHGDLKPENVLLDDNRTSKLCDFGISRLILVSSENTTINHKTDVKGTQDYLDPAFAQTGRLAPSSDVYSFGMVLLRFLTKGRVGYGLITEVDDAIDEQRLGNLLDEKAGWPYQLAEELSKLALGCCNPRPKRRPNIDEVRQQLEEMKKEFQEKHSTPIFSCAVLPQATDRSLDDSDDEVVFSLRDSSPKRHSDCAQVCEQEAEINQIYDQKLSTTLFSYTELELATSYFSGSNVLPNYDFEKAYKGILRDTEVAIKLPTNPTNAYQQEAFLREVAILSRLEHPNVVHLIGECPEKCALVYEFMPKTLEDRLVQKDLLWKDRLRIATEVCRALVYLHSLETIIVVHGDVKPANVLLDTNGVSKLGGFEMCLVRLKSNPTYTVTSIQGTHGYIDPAFTQSGKLEPSVDVYSFGMVLLRLLTKGTVGYGLITTVEDALEEQHLEYLLDDAANWPYHLAEQLCKLALRCCDSRPKRRPNTADVLENLEQMKKNLTS